MLEEACDSYFDREDVILSYPDESSNTGQPSTGLSNVVVRSDDDDETPPIVGVARIVDTSCLAIKEGPKVILPSLIRVGEENSAEMSIHSVTLFLQYVLETVLKNGRVSAQSLGLACVTAAVDLSPSVLSSLTPLIPFTTAGDPKLRNRAVKVFLSFSYTTLAVTCSLPGSQ